MGVVKIRETDGCEDMGVVKIQEMVVRI